MTIGKVLLTKNYVRYRLQNPAKFKRGTFRTQDIGKAGHSKRIAGRLKTTGEWKTQAILIAKKDYLKGVRLKKKGKTFLITPNDSEVL